MKCKTVFCYCASDEPGRDAANSRERGRERELERDKERQREIQRDRERERTRGRGSRYKSHFHKISIASMLKNTQTRPKSRQ